MITDIVEVSRQDERLMALPMSLSVWAETTNLQPAITAQGAR